MNIFAISAEGGAETALTTGTGTSDDPDFSPDGKCIYFNSDRAGGMQIFRMQPDGSQPEQVTFDERRNWTAHPSPDGKSILDSLLCERCDWAPGQQGRDPAHSGSGNEKVRDLVEIVGGSGTDNVPNWAPDGKHFAFVSYQMLPAEGDGASE